MNGEQTAMENTRKAPPLPQEEEKALVWGKNPVTELLKSGGAVDTVLLADSMPAAVAGYYTALAKQAGAVVKRAPSGKLQKLCGTTEHQGVAAWAAQVEYTDLEALLDIARQKNEPPFLVLCDGVEDPHNLGAIIRSAYLCGAHGVVIPRRGRHLHFRRAGPDRRRICGRSVRQTVTRSAWLLPAQKRQAASSSQ